MKHKCPAELNSRVIRINLDTYLVIRGLSLRDNITMDEALTKLIVGLKPEPKPQPVAVATKPAFRVMSPVAFQPAFTATAPVALRQRLSPALRQRLSPATATNGSKVPAFRINTKGVRYD